MRRESLLRDVRGQGIMEFALVIPILLIIVFGVVDLSRFAFYKLVMNQAARDTARLATVGEPLSTLTLTLKDITEPLIGTASLATSVGTDPQGNSATICLLSPSSGSQIKAYLNPPYSKSLVQGSTVRVSLYYRMSYLTPLGNMFGNYIDLKVLSVGRIETPPVT